MKKIKLNVWNRIAMQGSTIAAELPATSENLRHWIAIYSNNGKHVDRNVPSHKYSILDFELNKSLVDEYFSEKDKVNQVRYYVNNEDELYQLLERLNVDPELFDAPWHCEYPL